MCRAGGEGLTQMVAPDWVVDLFREAGLEARRCEEDEAESLLWGKLCVSCGINALTALLRIPNGELLERPDACRAHGPGGRGMRGCRSRERNKAAFFKSCSDTSRRWRNRPPPISPRCCRTFCAERRQNAMPSMALSRGKAGAWANLTPVNDILWLLVRAAGHQTGAIRNEDSR